jgi:hypothetical protein
MSVGVVISRYGAVKVIACLVERLIAQSVGRPPDRSQAMPLPLDAGQGHGGHPGQFGAG